jgi:transcriptional regulator with XRE-family HTH domain
VDGDTVVARFGYAARTNTESFGQRLKRLRQAAGLSQAKLARAAGVPHGSPRNWEYDLREPLVGAAAKIARALGVTLDELTGEGGAEEKARRKKGGK